MKWLFFFLLLIHALIHLIGFAREWRLAPTGAFSGETIFALSARLRSLSGLFWLNVSLLFIVAAFLWIRGGGYWWMIASPAIILSQVLIILYWKDARWGTVLNLVVAVVALSSWGNWKFNQLVTEQSTALLSTIPAAPAPVLTEEMIHHLPQPVRQWLKASGVMNKPLAQAVYLRQKGEMRTDPSKTKWIPCAAEQVINTVDPGFVWKVKMQMMPGVAVVGRDRFTGGRGEMQIRLAALYDLVDQSGLQVDVGSLQRYLSEICWYPSAAVQSYIHWTPLGEHAARATMTWKGLSGSVDFYFDAAGRLLRCKADRYMSTGKTAVLRPWEVETKEWGVLDGISMPVRSEVTWRLPEGDYTWFKLQVTDLSINRPLAP